MTYKESGTVELKREYTPELKKEIIAFANSEGGVLYVGIEDDGSIAGIDHADRVALQIGNMIRDTIKPDISMFVACKIITVEDRSVIQIDVQRGTMRPYYIAEKGLKPSGVYVRQHTSSVPASESAIRQLIKETDGDKFEDTRSLIQDLTFQETSLEFAKRHLDFGPTQMKTLGILTVDNIYTNLGLLFSDQCSHTVKVAVFAGNDKGDFQDRREFTGSLLKQLVSAYEFIDMHNKKKAEFAGLNRIDRRDYPEEAIREALLNALVHRDYAFSGSIMINLYRDKVEFISIGGLVPGLSVDDILLGVSQTRNEKLAAVMYRLRLIEAYGTGISKIMRSYEDSERKPELRVTDNAFLLSLPKMANGTLGQPLKSDEQIILDYISCHRGITRKETETLLSLGQTAAGNMLKGMVNKNLIQPVGSGRNTVYVRV